MSSVCKILLVLAMVLTSPLKASAAPSYAVTAIKAYLYYENDGEIDRRDLIQVGPGVLHNTVIGEGMAKRPSNTTLVLVDVSGPGFALKDVGSLSLKAETDWLDEQGKPQRRVLLQQGVDLNNVFQENQPRLVIPFWLYYTGSAPVILTATLKGGKDAQNQVSVLKRIIPFGGGE